jgi:hypothetical protein
MWCVRVVKSAALHIHPVVAAGIKSVPVDPHVAPPIRMSKAAVPLLAEIDVLEAVLQKPEAIEGAVALHAKFALAYKVPELVGKVIVGVPAAACGVMVTLPDVFPASCSCPLLTVGKPTTRVVSAPVLLFRKLNPVSLAKVLRYFRAPVES